MLVGIGKYPRLDAASIFPNRGKIRCVRVLWEKKGGTANSTYNGSALDYVRYILEVLMRARKQRYDVISIVADKVTLRASTVTWLMQYAFILRGLFWLTNRYS